MPISWPKPGNHRRSLSSSRPAGNNSVDLSLGSSGTRPMAGIALMVFATLILPSIDAIAKHLGEQISPVQITWGRFLFQFIFMALLWRLSRLAGLPTVPNLSVERPLLQLARGVLLAVATLLFFWSLRYLDIATAIAIFFIQPMILTLFSAWFLGETIGWHRRLAVACGFIGVLIIIRPGTSSFTLAALLPLGTALFFAGYLTLTRATSSGNSPIAMQFASGLGAFVLLSLTLALIALLDAGNISGWRPVWLTAGQWLWLLLLGLIAAGCHLLVVYATRLAAASQLAPFGYTEIIAATLFGWLFFDEWPQLSTWVGIGIIIGSGLYVCLREARASGNPGSGYR